MKVLNLLRVRGGVVVEVDRGGVGIGEGSIMGVGKRMRIDLEMKQVKIHMGMKTRKMVMRAIV